MALPDDQPDSESLRTHFERQIEHYNARRFDEYVRDIAEDVVYAGRTTTLRGKSEVRDFYKRFWDRFRMWTWRGEYEYRVFGRTGLAFGPYSNILEQLDGREEKQSGTTMVVFTFERNQWWRVAEKIIQHPAEN